MDPSGSQTEIRLLSEHCFALKIVRKQKKLLPAYNIQYLKEAKVPYCRLEWEPIGADCSGTPLRYLSTWEREVPAELVELEKRERFPGTFYRPWKLCLPINPHWNLAIKIPCSFCNQVKLFRSRNGRRWRHCIYTWWWHCEVGSGIMVSRHFIQILQDQRNKILDPVPT